MRQRLTRPAKEILKKGFPSLWVRWHQAHCAMEPELPLLKHIVPRDGVAVDIGANFGLYTRELAQIADVVHAFEPSKFMADILRRTTPANVVVHEMALSDRAGEASLRIPQSIDGPVHSLASLEPRSANMAEPSLSIDVALGRLDSLVRDNVRFVKIDVEGHELKVLEGANGLLERSEPIFLVEAEERHRNGAVSSIFDFFFNRAFRGFFLLDNAVRSAEHFAIASLQDHRSLQADGSRQPGRPYVNNFFFFPPSLDGQRILTAAAAAASAGVACGA